MTCDNFTQWISAALDGELTAEQRRELDAHLAHCPDCAALYELLSANSRAMRELDCEFPEGLHDRMMNNLPPQEAPKQKKVIHWKRWGSLAACLVVVAAVGVFARFGGIRMGSMAPAADMADPESESPLSPNAAPVEGHGVYNYSKTDDAAYSGEAEPGSTAPSVSPESAPATSMSPVIGGLTDEALPNVQYIRVGYGFTPAPSAVVISGTRSLADYLAGYGTNRFDGDGNPVPIAALEALPETYTEDFFETRSLLAILVEEGSGSIRHEVVSVTADTVTIRVIVPEAGTCDMAAWLILVELDEMLDDGSTLEVKFIH